MRIAATSDLHFTPQGYDRIREPLSHVKDEADVLVIAGDLTNYGKPEEMHSLLNALVRLRIPIIAVLGNHDDPDHRALDALLVPPQLDGECPALTYYQGFYLRPGADGQVCQGRDTVHARSGAECGIERFRLLTPKVAK